MVLSEAVENDLILETASQGFKRPRRFGKLWPATGVIWEVVKKSEKEFRGQKSPGSGLRVKTQRVKTSENFSEESNLPRRFRRYPEIL